MLNLEGSIANNFLFQHPTMRISNSTLTLLMIV